MIIIIIITSKLTLTPFVSPLKERASTPDQSLGGYLIAMALSMPSVSTPSSGISVISSLELASDALPESGRKRSSDTEVIQLVPPPDSARLLLYF